MIGESFGWVMGDVAPRGRGYFVVRITVPGAAYRVNVESYDAISASPGSGGPPAAPPAESPLMAP